MSCNNIVTIGSNKFEVTTKICGKRSRQFLRCMHVELGTNRRCTFEKRADSLIFKESNGNHQHTYDIRSLLAIPSQIQTKEKDEMYRKFVEFIAKSNISLRKCVSPNTISFFNSCILYGHSLGLKNIEISESTLWNFSNRNDLRNEIIRRSNNYCNEELQCFRKGIVSLSIDGAKFNQKKLVDIVLICNFHDKSVHTLLYDSLEIKNSDSDNFKKLAWDILMKLFNEGINVMSIISDGFSSQIAAFDLENSSALQNNIDAQINIRKILYVYCRCHLINLSLRDLISKSETIKKCHNLLKDISKKLRKTESRSKIGYKCPEQIQTRFCYDYLIVKFIACHINKIEEIIEIDKSIFVYGVLIEQLWNLIGELEERDATLANTYEKILKFYDSLKRIEEKSLLTNRCLYWNSKLLRNIVQYRLYKQYPLAIIAFSLTVKGHDYMRSLAGYNMQNADKSTKDERAESTEDQENGILEDFFFNSIIPQDNEIGDEDEDFSSCEYSFDHDETDGLIEFEETDEIDKIEEHEKFDIDQIDNNLQIEEKEEFDIDETDSNDGIEENKKFVEFDKIDDNSGNEENEFIEFVSTNEIETSNDDLEDNEKFDIDETDEFEFNGMTYDEAKIKNMVKEYEEMNEEKEKRYWAKGIIQITTEFVLNYSKRAGYDDLKTDKIIVQFMRWMSLDDLSNFSHMMKGSIHNFWYLMGFSKEWSELAEFARVITSIPVSEVENERMFSIKRNIVGKYQTKISPDLLNARARLARK